MPRPLAAKNYKKKARFRTKAEEQEFNRRFAMQERSKRVHQTVRAVDIVGKHSFKDTDSSGGKQRTKVTRQHKRGLRGSRI